MKDTAGRVLGRHGGVHRFTVGQRKGLGLASPVRLYVTALEAETGTVTVGPRDALERTTLTASRVNWISTPPAAGQRGRGADRHRHPEAPARVRPLADARARLEFDAPQAAIAPGQAVVVYDGDEVLAAGGSSRNQVWRGLRHRSFVPANSRRARQGAPAQTATCPASSTTGAWSSAGRLSRYRSASIAAMHPDPAAVTAWR